MIGMYNTYNMKPEFSITENAFKVILPNVNYVEERKNVVAERFTQKEKIIKYIEQYGKIKRDIGVIIRSLCERKGVELIEAEACPDHIHILVSIPPKISISSFMGYVKGKVP